MRQTDLAELAGCSRDTISRLETGKNQPQLRTALAIAASLNTDLAVLFPFTLTEHRGRTDGMTGTEKLAAFHALPEAMQQQATRDLAERVEADRTEAK
jgi:DNA-binding XRE family transcriptional regulator